MIQLPNNFLNSPKIQYLFRSTNFSQGKSYYFLFQELLFAAAKVNDHGEIYLKKSEPIQLAQIRHFCHSYRSEYLEATLAGLIAAKLVCWTAEQHLQILDWQRYVIPEKQGTAAMAGAKAGFQVAETTGGKADFQSNTIAGEKAVARFNPTTRLGLNSTSGAMANSATNASTPTYQQLLAVEKQAALRRQRLLKLQEQAQWDALEITATEKQVLLKLLRDFNQLTGKNFGVAIENIQPLLIQLRNGHSPALIKRVIQYKQQQWANTDFHAYIRPLTICGAKFAQYCNELPVQPSNGAKPKMIQHSRQEYLKLIIQQNNGDLSRIMRVIEVEHANFSQKEVEAALNDV
ncbi:MULTISPECIES: conserved phage C-terminal domain-containing protein [Loigolactobacillus]|uniref:conserved phage C-terminal domain-containing protein n=1 Tax=Loigolactobacillus TaxID=2767889 RepID=UPI0007F06906|nr:MULTISPECIES: conserved phage C-terminal domain-containing protein [Loigolactobacillus]ANK59129.1 hypothetical protein AYR52_01920 [Loigolactobacillus backii]ANK64118.1 hypothetical protein AYR54_01910 [Loigolactobacillus backii]ANK67488.1 hypothetical protein AYR55_07130 [Loigolactobacillus backii]MDA5387340.1 conserved phage C-terminal domain-containing protein [Loigolactobacillus backii]MDA5389879.1 conserved phage C-terminal domain-containing protein [Loigolactobacillus backii]